MTLLRELYAYGFLLVLWIGKSQYFESGVFPSSDADFWASLAIGITFIIIFSIFGHQSVSVSVRSTDSIGSAGGSGSGSRGESEPPTESEPTGEDGS